MLPTASKTELGLWAGLRGGRLSHAGAYVDNLGTVLPLAPGVFLDRVALGICLDPLKLKGAAAINMIGGGVKIDGSLEYAEAFAGAPWYVEARGGIEVYSNRMAEAYLKYQGTGMLDFGFNTQLVFGPASINGGVNGWVETRDPSRFNVKGNAKVCVDKIACATGEAVLSTIGVAGCLTVTVASVPVPYWKGPAPWDWGTNWVPVSVNGGAGLQVGRAQAQPDDRDLLNRHVRAARGLRAAQDGAPSVNLPDGLSAATIVVQGQGGAPKVTLVGPDGRRIASPGHPDGSFVKDDHLLSEDGDAQTTTVMVAKPAGG